MWKLTKAPTTNLFIQIALTLFILTILLLGDTANGLSDKRLCADEECKSKSSYLCTYIQRCSSGGGSGGVVKGVLQVFSF